MARKKMTKKQRTRQIIIRSAILFAIVVVAIVAMVVLLSGLGRTEIDLRDYVHIQLTGFNGDGVLTATTDVPEEYGAFFETVEVEFSRRTGLTNGEEVTITYNYDKKLAKTYKLKVKAGTQRFTVRDLVDPVNVSKEDIFEGVEIELEGIAPIVTASVNAENARFRDVISYKILGKQEYYDEGDVVRVRAVYSKEDLAEADCVSMVSTEECIKEYKVEDVDRYITEIDEITEDMMASLKKEALTYFSDANEYGMRIFCDAGLMPVYIDKKTTFQWNSPNFVSSYLNVLKESGYGKVGANVNDIKLVYESVISQADGTACRAEVVVSFSDIVVKTDGTVDLNLESGGIISADRRDSHIKALINNDLDDDYESVKM